MWTDHTFVLIRLAACRRYAPKSVALPWIARPLEDAEELSGRDGRLRLVVTILSVPAPPIGVPPHPAPLTANEVAAREWPALRCRLIDVAAALDRLDRAGATDVRDEARRLLAALLEDEGEARAERLLIRLSRPYDPGWRDRFAAGETSID